MTTHDALGSHREAWLAAGTIPVLSAEIADAALTAMELHQTRHLDEQQPIAERIAGTMREMGRWDLLLRAELVLTSIRVRKGDVVGAAHALPDILARARKRGDTFALARANYLLAWVGYFLGNRSEAQIHATRAVDLLAEDTIDGIRMDHVMIMAITCDQTPDARQYFDEALSLALRVGDPTRTITLYNNIAYSAMMQEDVPRALDYVEKMLAESERTGVPLVAVFAETVARAYLLGGRPAAAVEVLEPIRIEAEAGAKDTSSRYYTEPHAIAAGLLTLAIAHRELGDVQQAARLLADVEVIVAERGLGMLAPQVTEEHAHIAAARGDFEAAYATYRRFHRELMAQQNDEQVARARQLQATYNADAAKKDAERFRQLAMRDTLTGLHNRRYLDDLLAEEIARSRNGSAPLSLAMADVDFFKRINDTLSHEVGDAVLKRLATILVEVVSSLPHGGAVCRLGGEEFVIVMPGQDAAEAFAGMELLRQAVAGHDWSELTGSLPVSISIGVTTAYAGHTSASALLADADRNLYAAKRSGRNRVMADSFDGG